MANKFTARHLTEALQDLSMLEFFPSDEGARAAIMRTLARMCPHLEALEWLVRQFCDRIGRWHGPAELRAVLCTRYRPSDGIEAFSALPGFRPEDSEQRLMEEHEQLKIGWTAERPQLASANPRALKLIEGLMQRKGGLK